MRNGIMLAGLVAAATLGGVATTLLMKSHERIQAQDGKKESSKEGEPSLKATVLDADAIRARIKELKATIKENDETIEGLNHKRELERLEAIIKKDGDKAKIYIYGELGEKTWKPNKHFDAKGLESGLTLRAEPESFEIFETRDGEKLILLDSRTGDTWTHRFVEGRGNYWSPLPRSAERYNLVPRNYHKESGFNENRVEHRHRRKQIIEMMEELNRELEEMKGYEKR